MSKKTIFAKPTKNLFIEMLIRDISLNDSISDLIDNCVDGAIRLQKEDSSKKKEKIEDFSGLHVSININGDKFEIKDNCGGIASDLARKYAFRFGRPKDAPSIKYSVGQFGIGMKRALFKMGALFEIRSTWKRSRFKVTIDVREWEKDEENWNFSFDELQEKKTGEADFPKKMRGTEIIVKNLNPNVKNRFNQEKFISQLIEEIELEHLHNLNKGLRIKINGNKLKTNQLMLLDSDVFKTAHWKRTYKKYGEINTEIYAGISRELSEKGGWYIFCNERLILGPDKSITTGWGIRTPVRIPKYHIQFSRFRGYIFFTASDASLLPWNTSKNNVDIDSPIYRSVQQEMAKLHRSVIDFLNKVHNENVAYENEKISERKLEKAMKSATLKPYNEVTTSDSFVGPKVTEIKKPNEVFIKYKKPKNKVEKLQKLLEVSSAKEVGEKTFDTVYNMEFEE